MRYFVEQNSSSKILLMDTIRGKAKRLDEAPGNICYVIQKSFTNPLWNSTDTAKYYLIFRPEFFYGWSSERLANRESGRNTPGITIDLEIILRVARDISKGDLSCFAVATSDYRIFYIVGKDLLKLYRKFGHFEDERKNTMEVGLGVYDFTLTDPFS